MVSACDGRGILVTLANFRFLYKASTASRIAAATATLLASAQWLGWYPIRGSHGMPISSRLNLHRGDGPDFRAEWSAGFPKHVSMIHVRSEGRSKFARFEKISNLAATLDEISFPAGSAEWALLHADPRLNKIPCLKL